ncbi:MAG: hypothetical protein ACK5MG_04580 [Bacteroidales bacterium]
MGDQDIPWKQRFSNYQKTLQKLSEVTDFIKLNLEANDSTKRPNYVLN